MEQEYDQAPSSSVGKNTWAILQLLEGDESESLTLLHRAANESRDRLRRMEARLPSATTQPRSHEARICPVPLEGAMILGGNPSEMASPDNFFRMYRCVYSIEGPDCESEALTPEVMVVLLYNLAAVYQEVGYVNLDNAAIDKAMRLYELAKSFLYQTREVKQHKLGIDLVELELALLNNLGNTHCYFFNYDETMTLQESLRVLMDTLDPHRLNQETIAFFRTNLSSSARRNWGFAPAA